MKCPCCNGTGRTTMVTIVKTDSGLPCDFPCIECDGTGEVEMTNKYFMQTATTEQLAETLTDFSFWIVPNLPKEDKREQVRKWIENWLKEIHK